MQTSRKQSRSSNLFVTMFSFNRGFQVYYFVGKWGTEYFMPNSYCHNNVEWIIFSAQVQWGHKHCSDQTCPHTPHPILLRLQQQQPLAQRQLQPQRQIRPAAQPQNVRPMWPATRWAAELCGPATTITTCCGNSHPATTRVTPQHSPSQ
jgi:hypothetical protein